MRVVGGKTGTDGRLFAYLVWTVPGGPAEKMGLQQGDKVSNFRTLNKHIQLMFVLSQMMILTVVFRLVFLFFFHVNVLACAGCDNRFWNGMACH